MEPSSFSGISNFSKFFRQEHPCLLDTFLVLFIFSPYYGISLDLFDSDISNVMSQTRPDLSLDYLWDSSNELCITEIAPDN